MNLLKNISSLFPAMLPKIIPIIPNEISNANSIGDILVFPVIAKML
jgi:hypothetical protein